ncbi:uncharacterized protein LOC122713369 [Apis laboriosa]|uniref:uncharacterized protein LOC122713369 n=1 Tax=Apis laboriosa TaxID=183418 RepID=UPI001CC4CF4F|nr:uncharacterized protein LOC122713369 [Apis laboriosa]
MTTRILSLFVLCTMICQICLAKPAQVLQSQESLSPVKEATSEVVGNKRDQRSPQFGFLNEEFSNPILSRPGFPEPIVYPAQASESESFAESSAESISTNGGLSIEESQANAQSASFNFGPYSASFNVAESSSGSQSF